MGEAQAVHDTKEPWPTPGDSDLDVGADLENAVGWHPVVASGWCGVLVEDGEEALAPFRHRRVTGLRERDVVDEVRRVFELDAKPFAVGKLQRCHHVRLVLVSVVGRHRGEAEPKRRDRDPLGVGRRGAPRRFRV